MQITDLFDQLLKEKANVHWTHPLDRTDSLVGRRASTLGTQPLLGLRAERRTGACASRSGDLAVDGAPLSFAESAKRVAARAGLTRLLVLH